MGCPHVLLDDAGFEMLLARIVARVQRSPDRRVVIGLAGIAGSGKSTLAARLADAIGGAVALGLDGFHLPNATLRALGRYGRKGAPDTYDAPGFVALLRLYRDPAAVGPYPVYDRDNTHEPILAPDVIDASVRVLIAEGQFLLLDQKPWDELGDVLDETWFLDTPLETARRWILARHTATGRTPQQAEVKYANDLRHSRLVLASSRPADAVLRWPG